MLLLVVLVRVAVQWNLPMPVCWMRLLLGVPCPACGSTRCLLAWSRFDLAQAFQLNPLVCLAVVGTIAWCALWLAARLLHHPFSDGFWRGKNPTPRLALLAVVVALNWFYLCWTLPL